MKLWLIAIVSFILVGIFSIAESLWEIQTSIINVNCPGLPISGLSTCLTLSQTLLTNNVKIALASLLLFGLAISWHRHWFNITVAAILLIILLDSAYAQWQISQGVNCGIITPLGNAYCKTSFDWNQINMYWFVIFGTSIILGGQAILSLFHRKGTSVVQFG